MTKDELKELWEEELDPNRRPEYPRNDFFKLLRWERRPLLVWDINRNNPDMKGIFDIIEKLLNSCEFSSPMYMQAVWRWGCVR